MKIRGFYYRGDNMDFEKIVKDISNNLFFLTEEDLDSMRKKIAGNDEKLKVIADFGDEILGMKELSVLDKSKIAPSGNKKDYVSFATYWWPNPDTADGLPYVVRDGEFNPEGYEYDKYSMKKMCYSAWVMGVFNLLTDDNRYADKFIKIIDTWFLDEKTGMNPHLKYGQFIPGICEGRDVGLIDTATILPFLLNIYEHLLKGGKISQETDEKFRGWITGYFEWLYNSPLGEGEDKRVNNHGTWHDIQVTSLAIFCGREDIAKTQYLKGLKRFDQQIDDEGKQVFEIKRTRSFNYSIMGLRGQMDLLALGERLGMDSWNNDLIKRSCMWIGKYLTQEEKWEYEQITPVDNSICIYPILKINEKYDLKIGSVRSDESTISKFLFI